jgi:HEAT repeat protein
MRASLLPTLPAVLVLSLAGCKGGDARTVKYWVEKTQAEHTEREKKADLDHLAQVAKTSKEPGAAAQVATLLKDQPGDVVERAAQVLGELGDKSVVPQLVEAIDLSRGAGADKATEQTNHANRAIAEALGKLGDKGGTAGLVKLLRSKDNYTVINAINGLGEVRDQSAVKPLAELATDSSIETFVNKKAIMALGSIGDPGALPAVHQMLYEERKGVSFFPESSFAMYEIGRASTDLLLVDLKGGTPEFKEWVKAHGILHGAVLAKSAQILGDLNDPRAEQALLGLLTYKDDEAQLQLATRIQAADALGRMRSKGAVKPLTDMLGEQEVAARNAYLRALSFIGDKSVVPMLLAKAGGKDSIGYRESAFKSAALLGSDSDLKGYDALVAGEDKRLAAECKQSDIGDADCAAQIKEVTERLKAYRGALATGCASGNAACWTQKLTDANPFARERAALELGRAGKADALAPLMATVEKPLDAKTNDEVANQDEARFASILAIHWLLDAGAKPADLAALAGRLEKQADEERKKTSSMRSAEDVKRLAIRLRRG